MRIAVCLKQVVTRDGVVQANEASTWIREDQASWELNESDGYALEAALRLRERLAADVTAVSAGPARVTAVLRDALARGADRALHVAWPEGTQADACATAAALADALRGEPFDLLLTGLQSSDRGDGQVGPMLAEYLGIPHATLIVAIEPTPGGIRAKRELEGGWSQWLAMPTPALVTVQSGLHPLRYATLRGIMSAKQKPLRTHDVAPGPGRVHVVGLSAPGRRRQTTMLGGAPDEAARALIRALREDVDAI